MSIRASHLRSVRGGPLDQVESPGRRWSLCLRSVDSDVPPSYRGESGASPDEGSNRFIPGPVPRVPTPGASPECHIPTWGRPEHRLGAPSPAPVVKRNHASLRNSKSLFESERECRSQLRSQPARSSSGRIAGSQPVHTGSNPVRVTTVCSSIWESTPFGSGRLGVRIPSRGPRHAVPRGAATSFYSRGEAESRRRAKPESSRANRSESAADGNVRVTRRCVLMGAPTSETQGAFV